MLVIKYSQTPSSAFWRFVATFHSEHPVSKTDVRNDREETSGGPFLCLNFTFDIFVSIGVNGPTDWQWLNEDVRDFSNCSIFIRECVDECKHDKKSEKKDKRREFINFDLINLQKKINFFFLRKKKYIFFTVFFYFHLFQLINFFSKVYNK